MEINQIVSLAVYGLTIFVVLIGFLLGLWKGLKKASLRLAVFLVFVIIAALISMPISKALMGIKININGTVATISDQILNLLLSVETIADFYSSSPAFQQLINALPVAILNFVVFMLMILITYLIGFVVYLILSAIIIKKRKKPYIVKNGKAEVVSDYNPEKKRRLLGGAIGAVQAFIFLFVLLMPITAISSIVGDLAGSTQEKVAYASSETQFNYTPTSKLIRENIPSNILKIFDGYNSTLFAKISNIGNFDQLCFDTLTTVKVENQKITLRKEINNIAKVYDNVDFLISLDLENTKLSELDYQKLENALDSLFDSGLLKSLLPQVLDYALDAVVSEEGLMGYKLPAEYKNYAVVLKADFDQRQNIEYIKEDVYSVFGIVKALGESGILDELIKDSIQLDNVLNHVNKNQRAVVSNVVSNLLNSNTAKTLLVEFLNTSIESVDKTDELVEIPEIEKTKIDWTKVKTEITTITNSILDIYVNITENVDVEQLSELTSKPTKLLNLDTDKLTASLSKIFDNLQNSNLLVSEGEDKIYDKLIDVFENTSYSKFVDLTVFKQPNSWSTEFDYLNQALKTIKNSGVVSTLTEENIDVELVFDKLASKDQTNNQTYIRNIVSPLLDSKAFERTITNLGFDYIDNLIEQYQGEIGENVQLGKIQGEKLSQDNEKELVVAFFENVFVYAEDLSLEQLKQDAFAEIITSNLSRLGSALDSIKASALFGPYEEDSEENKGIYINLIDALANNDNYNKFADFEVAKLDDFSWNYELSILQDAIDILNTITIEVDETEKTVLNAIKDGDDLTAIFENLPTENDEVSKIVNALAESRLMKKNLVLIINTINSTLADVLSVEIESLDENTDLSNEKQTVIDVLENIIELYSIVKDGMNDDILKDNYQDIGKLLNLLMTSKTQEGIFSGTYDGFIEYIYNSSYGVKVQYLLSQYENKSDVDWIQILEVAVETDSYSGESISNSLKEKLSSLVEVVYNDLECGSIMGTLIDIANDFTTLNSNTEAKDALNMLIDAFASLEQYNETYQKVHKVISFIENLTQITDTNDLKSVNNFTEEKTRILNILTAVEAFETTVSQENIENLIGALSQSEFTINSMIKYDINFEIETSYNDIVSEYISNNVDDDNLAENLKIIFGLV